MIVVMRCFKVSSIIQVRMRVGMCRRGDVMWMRQVLALVWLAVLVYIAMQVTVDVSVGVAVHKAAMATRVLVDVFMGVFMFVTVWHNRCVMCGHDSSSDVACVRSATLKRNQYYPSSTRIIVENYRFRVVWSNAV
jgi:hypothetical protein